MPTTTEVILTEKIYNLGAEADIVKVKTGYARNFLIPRGKALEITPATLRRINLLKAKRAEREAQELNEAQDLARKIGKVKLEIELETGETGKAFGSVTAQDIADKLRAALGGNIEIDRHKIHLERPIKDSGKHEVTIKLHHDVTATVEVNVAAKGAAPAEGEAKEEEKPAGGYKAKAKAKHKTKGEEAKS
jgi:large subunit ribosomal protein L9